jgi:branched-chain amino acid transport system permease protein
VSRTAKWIWTLIIGVPLLAAAIWGLIDNAKLFLLAFMNGLTLVRFYFLVASGFTLVFGLMRNVNLAHGSLYLLGAYIGYLVGDWSGSWLLAVAAGFLSAALIGLLMQVVVFPLHAGQDLRQTMVTIGLSIVLADIMLWIFGAEIYTFDPPRVIYGATPLPSSLRIQTYRLVCC